MADPSTQELRRRILKGRIDTKPPPYFFPDQGEYDESQADIPKTDKMKYIETKYGVKLKLDIYNGSINDVCSRYGWEVDRSTISRWRKIIRRYLVSL